MASAMEKYRETTNKVGPVGCAISTVIGLSVPIAMIVMGALYQDDCPAERFIPLYLIVSGAFSCVNLVIKCISNCLADDEGNKPVCFEIISGLVGLFLLAWFIAGNVWIYGLHGKYSTDPADSNFCNETLYLFAFWVTTVGYIILGALLVLGCCMCVCVACCGRN